METVSKNNLRIPPNLFLMIKALAVVEGFGINAGNQEASAAEIEASDDPFLRLAVALYDSDMAREEENEAMAGEFLLLRPRYMEAMIACQRLYSGRRFE